MRNVLNLIGSLTGFGLYASPIVNGMSTISTDIGSVILKDGLTLNYRPSSISIAHVSPGKKVRVYIVDTLLANDPGAGNDCLSIRCLAAGCDGDSSTPRGVYEGGLIVLGHVELSAMPTNERTDKPLDTRERTTLLAIIGALATAAKLDLSQHNKAGETVAAMLAAQGVTLSGRAIGEHLKAVREAMNSRKVK